MQPQLYLNSCFGIVEVFLINNQTGVSSAQMVIAN